MSSRERLAVALVLEGPTATEIDGMRRALGSSARARIAPHITLAPPVNVPADRLEDVLAQVRAVASSQGPIDVQLGPVATFWPATPVVYLAVSGAERALESIHRELSSPEGALSPPRARTSRPFVPHVTLDHRVDPERIDHVLPALCSYEVAYRFERLSVLKWDPSQAWLEIADVGLCRPAVVGRGTHGSASGIELAVVRQLDPLAGGWVAAQWARYGAGRYGPGLAPDDPFAVVARLEAETRAKQRDERPGSAEGSRESSLRRTVVGVAEGEVRGGTCRLARLIVAEELRGEGIGSKLLSAVEQMAAERSCTAVRLETAASGPARRFYEDRGYEATASLPAWRHGQDFVVLERSLTVLAPPPGPIR